MTTNDVLSTLLLLAVVPIVVYYAVKFGTYANLRARDLYYRRHPQQGKTHGKED